MLLPPLTWPVPDPNAPKRGFCIATVWHYVCIGFSENLSNFKTRFWPNPGAPPKNTKWGARQHKYKFCHFSRSLVLGLSIEISRPQIWKTHSPRSSGHVRPRRRSATLRRTRKKGAGPQVRIRNRCAQKPHFQHVAPRRRRVFLGALALTAARRKPMRHYKNRDFPPSDAAHPIFERITGSILERIGEKKAPHYRTQ